MTWELFQGPRLLSQSKRATIKNQEKRGQGKRKCLTGTDLKVFSFGFRQVVLLFPGDRWKQSSALQVSARVCWGSTALVTVGALEAGEPCDCRRAERERPSAMQLLSWPETRQHLGELPHAVSPCYSVLSASYERGGVFYQRKTGSAHVPDELPIPSTRLLTQLPVNAICDVRKWLRSLCTGQTARGLSFITVIG